jgi:hypothetical protein
MILDERTEFCDATSVALTAGAAWQNIGDVIPLTKIRNIAVGMPIYLVIGITTSIIGSTDATGTFALRLVSDTSDNPPHVSTSTVHWTGQYVSTNTTAVAGLTAGVRYACIALPEISDYETYLGIQANVATRSTTAGAINAFLTLDPNQWKAYADALPS